MFELGGGSSGGLGELPRSCGVRDRGLLVMSMLLGWSFGGLFGGGAAGNLKDCEKEPEALRDLLGSAGVFGAVETPGVLLPWRIGSGNWLDGSCIVGGKEAPPNWGEWVAERWPGDSTVTCQTAQAQGAMIHT